MSIVIPNLSKEAFYCTDNEHELRFSRRPFPPAFDEFRDITNAEGETAYFNSVIYLVEKQSPMLFCGGVSGSFIDQEVQAICCTDFVLAKNLVGAVIVADFAWMNNCRVKEVFATMAFLSRGSANMVFCTNGVLDRMEIQRLVIQGAVVIKDCTIDQIVLLDEESRRDQLRSVEKVAEKHICLDFASDMHDYAFPVVQLINTRQPIADAHTIDLLTRRMAPSNAHIQSAERLLNSFFEMIKASPINVFNNRNASWSLALFDKSINPDQMLECCICLESFSKNEPFLGHHANISSNNTNIFHCCCYPCFSGMIASGQDTCPLCRCAFTAQDKWLDINDRWESEWESSYSELMGLNSLMTYAEHGPSRFSRIWEYFSYYKNFFWQ